MLINMASLTESGRISVNLCDVHFVSVNGRNYLISHGIGDREKEHNLVIKARPVKMYVCSTTLQNKEVGRKERIVIGGKRTHFVCLILLAHHFPLANFFPMFINDNIKKYKIK